MRRTRASGLRRPPGPRCRRHPGRGRTAGRGLGNRPFGHAAQRGLGTGAPGHAAQRGLGTGAPGRTARAPRTLSGGAWREPGSGPGPAAGLLAALRPLSSAIASAKAGRASVRPADTPFEVTRRAAVPTSTSTSRATAHPVEERAA